MKTRALLAIAVLGIALPALAQTCTSPQVPVAGNCTLVTILGWAAAGGGTQSVINFYVPPNAIGPINFEVTGLSSSLGSAYTGYFGILVGAPGQPGSYGVQTLADLISNTSDNNNQIYPATSNSVLITQVCWDPTCTTAAPANANPDMFSMQIIAQSPFSSDIALGPNPLLTIQFVNGSQVTWQETESAGRTNSAFDYIPGINLGATPATRYVYNGAAVTTPFDAISISNINNTQPITGSVIIQDVNANTIATATIPAIPPGGAAGYLLIGRNPADTLGLFPSSTVLPADANGIFHGSLLVGTTGQITAGFTTVLAQEYNGDSMLNLPVLHGTVP